MSEILNKALTETWNLTGTKKPGDINCNLCVIMYYLGTC